MRLPPMVERGLRRSFEAVPRQTVTIYDWHSPEGQRFLDHVAAAVDGGVDVDRIGALLGIRNFSHRYKMLRKKGGGT